MTGDRGDTADGRRASMHLERGGPGVHTFRGTAGYSSPPARACVVGKGLSHTAACPENRLTSGHQVLCPFADFGFAAIAMIDADGGTLSPHLQ
jgi:hypothetical protein